MEECNSTSRNRCSFLRNKMLGGFLLGIVVCGLLFWGGKSVGRKLSSDESCSACHVHPHATQSWKESSHYNNSSGMVVHCVDCHLPPSEDISHITEKIKAGMNSMKVYMFSDTEKINWEQKSQLENAVNYTYDASCLKCHQNLFPLDLSAKGDEAHLYYQHNKEDLRCVNCHLGVGHGEKTPHMENFEFLKQTIKSSIFSSAATVSDFSDFKESIPGTSVSFDMVAIELGESNSVLDKGKENIKKGFFIGRHEVSWNEYRAFLCETESEGRIVEKIKIDESGDVDAITGATPPFGDPSQGWGMGQRPAITMTWHAAQTYCRWLSLKTGKRYRLPTKAEWLFACGVESGDEFFFGGVASDYQAEGLWGRIFKTTSDRIDQYVVWSGNSDGKTHLPDIMKPNSFGLINMLGNVKEFCSDEYVLEDSDIHSGVCEHVVMGGSFKSGVKDLRWGGADRTRHEKWMRTDPQVPKSIWWYSDCNDVGFRVVCEYSESEK